ncbi:MAG: GNAT family N-acetyltransferase, partial [Elusimicrobia bacterium]|nr:GNAT family N-acetyltransferase [Elusimicrobiota bacterium]
METTIRRPAGTEELEACARIMSGQEPWLTLRRGYDQALALLKNPEREVYVAAAGGTVDGFIILAMGGAFPGYIQTIALAPDRQGRGIGSRLIAFAEKRIFRESPNAFICVSDFNPGARRLYERLGYQLVGELKDYVVAGHSELLLRKSIGPLSDFRPP